MSMGRWFGSILAASAIALAAARGSEAPGDRLANEFRDPPASARPWVYWWWLESNVSREGITRDLEEMRRVGIGGALIFDAGSSSYRGMKQTPPGPEFMGAEWRALFAHAVREADRLGLELGFNLGSGWDCGGPWVPPELGAQKIVWTETRVEGPRAFEGMIEKPAGSRDVAIVAIPDPSLGIRAASRMEASSSERPYPVARAADGDSETFWVSGGEQPGEGPTAERPEWVLLEYDEPFAAAALVIAPRPKYGPRACEIQASSDGETFAKVATIAVTDDAWQTFPFPETKARFFRLLIRSSADPRFPENPRNVQISEIALLAPGEILRTPPGRIRDWARKTVNAFVPWGPNGVPGETLLDDDPDVPGEAATSPEGVIDLTDRLDASERLAWDVPDGRWTILRFGHAPTGKRVSTCSPGGHGLMVDHLSREAMDLHFRAAAEPLLAEIGALAGKSFAYFHCDSWEVGPVNWTAAFPAEFRARRGYDIRPFLPVLAGRIIGGRAVSNRFLHDFRRTISDLIADNHYGRFRDLAHARGVGYRAEAGGPHPMALDTLQCLGRCDLPMGEFWARAATHRVADWQRIFVKQAASAAHIYGRTLVLAEAFTSIGPHWNEDPYYLKPTADRAFCEGLNRSYMHTFTHSPAEAGIPGNEYFAGTHFNPNITWWRQSPAWLDYLSRCQHLLQQGLFVADVCYYYGDHTPNFVPVKRIDPSLGPGYDFDVTNAEVILTRMRVEGDRIALPDGMSYRLLVLPDRDAIAPEVLAKVADLVRAGATVVGPRPVRATGLRDYPRCDAKVRALAGEIWGACDGDRVKENAAGKGRVVRGKTLREILLAAGVAPDFEVPAADGERHLDFIHRRAGETDIYFVANRNERQEDAVCTFRVRGKVPEFWDPVTGETAPAPSWDAFDGRTRVRIRVAPYGSIFVIFREPARGLAPGISHLDAEAVSAAEIRGPWEVRFQAGRGAPASATFDELRSWTESADAGIKYFSGTACYTKRIEIPPALLASNRRVLIDLGAVKNIAEVRLNGAPLGVLWMHPFVIDVARVAKPGENVLEVEVTNLWPNRLIGDAGLPEEERFTRTNVTSYTEDSPLLPSGLLGPVRILVEEERVAEPAIRRAVPEPLPDHPGNIYLAGEPVSIRVPDEIAGEPAGWRIIDDAGAEIARGSLRAGSREPIEAGTLGIGWYRVEFLGEGDRVAGWTSAAVLARLSAPTPADSPISIDTAAAWFAHGDPAKQECFARLAALAGINWIRDRLRWREIQPRSDTFAEATTYDSSADIHAREGVKVLQVFHDTPEWAVEEGGRRGRFPGDLRVLYAFARAMGERFRGRVQAWEPWNEANVRSFGGHTIDEMCSLQKAAYLGFRAGDPEAIVGWNAYAGVPAAGHTREVIENEAWPYFDTYNIHTYDLPHTYLENWAPAREAACGRPLWITESDRGIKHDGRGPWFDLAPRDERHKAEFMAQSYASSLFAGASRHFHFILGNYQESGNGVQFGLLRLDLTPRPSYIALAAVGRLLAGARCLGRLPPAVEPNAHVIAFRARPDGRERDVLVAWAEKQADWPERGKTTAAWSLPDGIAVEEVFDYLGRSKGKDVPPLLRSAPIFVILRAGDAKRLSLESPPRPDPRREGAPSPIVLQIDIPTGTIEPYSERPWSYSHERTFEGEEAVLGIIAYNFSGEAARGRIDVERIPEGWSLTPASREIEIPPKGRVRCEARLRVPAAARSAFPESWVKLRGEFGGAGRTAIAFRIR
ncbi:MAG: discoidin domain-containing protein [Planctomycetes bacterium]|nr:discoidin domain-containing protein [Planctomycetota bacterium]